MKIMFYALRPFDERAYCEPYSKQYGIDYAYTACQRLRCRQHQPLPDCTGISGSLGRDGGQIPALPQHWL